MRSDLKGEGSVCSKWGKRGSPFRGGQEEEGARLGHPPPREGRGGLPLP